MTHSGRARNSLKSSSALCRQIGPRLTDFPISKDLFLKFGHLQGHSGYSAVKDVHLFDPEFPSAITCTPSEAQLLYTLVDKLNPQRPLEIGSYMGWSTAHIALALKNTRLQCIEPFFETDDFFNQITSGPAQERFRQNMKRCELWDKIILITESSPECLGAYHPQDGWDFLFLDGWHNHGQPLKDVEEVLPFLSANAVVALHDPWVPDVRDAMLYLMDNGFYVYSLDTANFLTICFRGEAFKGWDEFYRIASGAEHRIEQAHIMRQYSGLCERSIREACKAFKISYNYRHSV
jgi:predicted O-methyltransferase YrrM